ncbi:MAG: BrnT family toxin [Methyloligellaceae bacterium]
MKIDGFDWDDGNWPKCAKHGLTKHAIEGALSGEITIFDDPVDPTTERRFRAIGNDAARRMIFIVFCFRRRQGKTFLRPISARYMHDKEVQHYERQKDT